MKNWTTWACPPWRQKWAIRGGFARAKNRFPTWQEPKATAAAPQIPKADARVSALKAG